MYTTKLSFGISYLLMLLSEPRRKITFGFVVFTVRSSPSSRALISPMWRFKTLKPFHPISGLINLEFRTNYLHLSTMAGPSFLVRTSLPRISIGVLDFLSSWFKLLVPLIRSLRMAGSLPRWMY